MNTENNKPVANEDVDSAVSRRNMLHALATAASVTAVGAGSSTRANEEQAGAPQAKNPYGGKPGGGITLPLYFRPTPSVVNGNNYFPLAEKLGPDEMRIALVGSCPFPPKWDQAGTSIMVELGNGDRFFFDLGAGSLRNIVAMQVPFQLINDIASWTARRGEEIAHHHRDSPTERSVADVGIRS